MNIKELKNNFLYDEETGQIIRTTRKNSNGSYDKDGYLIIKFKSKQYKAHRLVWLYHKGSYPKYGIDHINRNRKDNRIENLRDVPQKINCWNSNKKVNPETGVCGVYIDKTNGLKKKYTVKYREKTHRFYFLSDAVKKRKQIWKKNKYQMNL